MPVTAYWLARCSPLFLSWDLFWKTAEAGDPLPDHAPYSWDFPSGPFTYFPLLWLLSHGDQALVWLWLWPDIWPLDPSCGSVCSLLPSHDVLPGLLTLPMTHFLPTLQHKPSRQEVLFLIQCHLIPRPSVHSGLMGLSVGRKALGFRSL